MVKSLESPDLDDADRETLARIERFGWTCLHIEAGERTCGWSFSLGLPAQRNHPELIVFGLPNSDAYDVLADAVARITAGETLPLGREHAVELSGITCSLLKVERVWYRPFVGTAIWYHESLDFETLQIAWRNTRGQNAWEIPAEKARQPLLDRIDACEARTGEFLREMGFVEE